MLAIPAIDIRDGRCVRLLRGDFNAETVYGDPLEVARDYVAEGAQMLHLVDLDAARGGGAANADVIRSIVAELPIPVQVGGGVRDAVRAGELLSQGVARVVIGTLAVEDPDAACALAFSYPDRIVAGLDHRADPAGAKRRIVAVRGWEDSGGVELTEALDRLAAAPFAATVITDISRDGTLEGPDTDGYEELLAVTKLAIIASGGISSTADLTALAALGVSGQRLFGAVIGRALLSGAMTVGEAIAACAT